VASLHWKHSSPSAALKIHWLKPSQSGHSLSAFSPSAPAREERYKSMLRYILQRLILIPVLLFLFSAMVFTLVQAPPGDFLTSYIATLASSGSSLEKEEIEMLKQQYGLDQPAYIQYLRWMQNLLRGNLGLSLEYQRPNSELILERLGLTVILALFAFIFTWAVAIPVGIYSATHRNSFLDHLFTVVNYIGVAIPNFMLALILMWWAYSAFDVSVTGMYSREFEQAPWNLAKFIDMLKHIWLPMIVIGLSGTARLTRVMRANLLDELDKPYMIAGRARGLSERRLVMKYPVRLAINPLISTIGWYLPELFSGSLIVATVMSLQNIGPLLLRSLVSQDMYLAGSILLIYCFLAIIGTLISDILIVWLDPRIRMEKT
jgi:peptide/nickel transport system permease protein